MTVIQQSRNGPIEKYIDLRCDLSEGVYKSAVSYLPEIMFHCDLSIEELYRIVSIRKLGIRETRAPHIPHLCCIVVQAEIDFLSARHLIAWRKDPLYPEYCRFRGDDTIRQLPVVLSHPGVFLDVIDGIVPERCLFQIDGMHRIMSALADEVYTIQACVITRRADLSHYVDNETVRKAKYALSQSRWFEHYQEIIEFGFKGQREWLDRYTRVYDFSFLKGKSVVDFGGSTGQALIEAYFHGAGPLYNFEIQDCIVEVADLIGNHLGMPVINTVADFNSPEFETVVLKVVESWDWAVFQAIYRTKEIEDVRKLFKFIVDRTREGIVFEGNGDGDIDTDEFYQAVFAPFKFSSIEFLGHSQSRPAYILRR